MYALLGKLAQYELQKVQDLWAEHGDELIDAGQGAFETVKEGVETIIDNIADLF